MTTRPTSPIAEADALDTQLISGWDAAVDKLLQTSLLLVFAKLAGSWLVVAIWGVPLRDRLIWGFVPYVGLETTPAMFRTVAAWSTAGVAATAALWTVWNLRRRHRLPIPAVAWASALSLPMAALLAIFEWMRRTDASHLLPTGWMVWTLCGLGAVTALILGFFELPQAPEQVESVRQLPPPPPPQTELVPQPASFPPQPTPQGAPSMSDDTPNPRRRKRAARTGLRFTRRSASILIALMLVAAPAGASIIVQNYMEADITAAPPCFVKETGTDPTNSTQASFTNDPIASATNPTPDVITVDNVSLLEEKITVTGMIGDRVIYTDVVRYVNNCDEDITVQLSTTGITGTWTGIAAEIWISESETPAAIDPNLDPAATDDWNDDPIKIPAGSPAAFADTTGAVIIPAGEERFGAFVVSTDVTFTAGTATVNWVASATI